MTTDVMHEPSVIVSDAGDSVDLGGFGVDWKIDGRDTGERFAIVHHSITPWTLAAPLHYHHNEDECSYVLKGTLGALLGDEVITAEPGTWVAKPREQWHTFWSAGDSPCHIIEIISPAGFENYFREIAETSGDVQRVKHINQKYSLEMPGDIEGRVRWQAAESLEINPRMSHISCTLRTASLEQWGGDPAGCARRGPLPSDRSISNARRIS